jgi:hypothetical protein
MDQLYVRDCYRDFGWILNRGAEAVGLDVISVGGEPTFEQFSETKSVQLVISSRLSC